MRVRLFLILIFGYGSCFGQLPTGFVYVTDSIPTIKVELRYCSDNNFLASIVDGYEAEMAILTAQATKALKNVQNELAGQNLSIKIFDSYRPQRAVNHFIRWAKDLNDTINKSSFYPDVAKQHLFREEYIASRSGHSRGSTLDITLVDLKTNKELDMGSTYDFFGSESWVDYEQITPKQKENRMLLQTVMLKHGFRNYPKEWWHFTLRGEPFPDTYFDFIVE